MSAQCSLPMTSRPQVTLVTGLVLTLACSGQDVAQGDVAQGEVSAFSAARGILAQELRIDGYAEDLLPIRRLAVAADGTIAISQPIDQAIRFFSDDGMPLGAFGGRGQGPGEFTAMSRMGWLADSLWVDDLLQGRVTVISPELSLVRTVRVPRRAIPGPGVPGGSTVPSVSPLALVANNELLAILSFNPDAPVEINGTRTVARIMLDGTVSHVIATLPIGQSMILFPGGAVSQPFPNRTSEAVSPYGRRVGAALATLDGPDAESIEVSVWTADGDMVFVRRYGFEGVPIPSAVADSVLQERVASLGEGQLREAFESEAFVPPFWPPLRSLLVGQDDTVWIERRLEEDGRPYVVLDPDGDPIGTVVIPEGSRIAAAQRDRVWILESDDLGVQSVVRYAVTWADPS